MRSLAGYSVISYLLQLKDRYIFLSYSQADLERHNGNILLSHDGYLIHIDFGFMLSNSPGSVGFELSPFKLPQEYIDVLGGVGSTKFKEFRELVKEAFLGLRKRVDHIVGLVEMMEKGTSFLLFVRLTW